MPDLEMVLVDYKCYVGTRIWNPRPSVPIAISFSVTTAEHKTATSVPSTTPATSPMELELDSRILRKLDRNLLPLVTIFFFLSFLDRANIGNARVAGLEHDLGLTEKQYKICLTALFVPYILSEVPSNLLLKVVGPCWLLPAMLTTWGIITCLQGLVTGFNQLLAARFFLGLVEGPMVPGIILYLSGFYTRRELGMRIATIFAAASFSGAFSGLLAAAISMMDGLGRKRGWAWIFILEGLLSFGVGVCGFFLVPPSLAQSKFLTEEEREAVKTHLDRDRPAILNGDAFQAKEVGRALLSPHVVILMLLFFFHGTTTYGLTIFMPTIVNSLGFSPIKSQLLAVGPFACAFVAALFSSYMSDKFNSRAVPIACGAILSTIGYIIHLCTDRTYALYGSLFLMAAGSFSVAPLSSAWVSNNSEPHYRRATVIGLGAVFVNSGGILSTWMYPTSAAPKYTGTIIMNLAFMLLIGFTSVVNGLLLSRWNKQKQDPVKRQKMLAPYYENNKADFESSFSHEEEANKQAWLGLGDKHPDFKYTL